jgi:pimeloyl-ACP methyl ester carboxylesterase
MAGERAFLRELSSSPPENLVQTVQQADADEQRILRIALGDSEFEAIRSMRASGLRGTMPKGNVVVLHGIMGSELTLFDDDGQDLIWVNLFHLLGGQFERLALDDSGFSVRDVRPSGIYLRYYARQIAFLSQNWKVRPFFFDWRRDIRLAAADLHQSIDSWFGADAPVHFVAHSMGGLVARCFITLFPQRWKAGRLIMLGTPNYGSFAIPRLLSGFNQALKVIATIDIHHGMDALLKVAATFPGIYQMMPALGKLPGLDALYRAATYTSVPVAQRHLDDALSFQKQISGAVDPSRMVYIAGCNRVTPVNLTPDGYAWSTAGDGTVPHNLGLLEGVPTYFVDEEHMKLPRNTSILDAMDDLLETGESVLSKQPPAARTASTPAHTMPNRDCKGESIVLPTSAGLVTQAEQDVADLIFLHEGPPPAEPAPEPPRRICVRIVIDSIENVKIPLDAIAVGHYLGVRPTGAEYDLDAALTAACGLPGEDPLLTQFQDRGILRGHLGEMFLLPDPRNPAVLIAIAGMGLSGTFGASELTVLARELCWTLGQLGKKHLASVLIGSSGNNLTPAQAIHAFLSGVSRAVEDNSTRGLEAITFVVREFAFAEAVGALRRAATVMKGPAFNLELQLPDLPPEVFPETPATGRDLPAAHLSIEFADGVCRYSALADGASVAQRELRVSPSRIREINQRLLLETNPEKRYRLGRFLLEFLFPREFAAQLTGPAPVVLACNSEAAQVYWELAAQPLDDANPYLGLARGLTRQLRTVVAPPPEPPAPARRELRVLLVADTCKEKPLPGAQEEARRLLAIFQKDSRIRCTTLIGPGEATALNVLLELGERPPYDVLHYAGHCCSNEAGFLFSGGDVLGANDLDRVDRIPRFVFSNACESGVLSSPAFAESFFKNGVVDFICTAWPVEDGAAACFAYELYANLLDAFPMWEAMRAARQAIRESRSWAAYQHYGNPYFRLLKPNRHA